MTFYCLQLLYSIIANAYRLQQNLSTCRWLDVGFLTLISTLNMGCYLFVAANYLPFHRLRNGMPFSLYFQRNVDYQFKRANLYNLQLTYLPHFKRLKSFNHLLLKSHTKQIHIPPFLTHSPMSSPFSQLPAKVLNALKIS